MKHRLKEFTDLWNYKQNTFNHVIYKNQLNEGLGIMKKAISFLIFSFIMLVYLQAQNSIAVKKVNSLNTQSILLVKTENFKQDSTSFKTPKYRQGFFCNFEDQLNRKKVPIDFSLGKSKY